MKMFCSKKCKIGFRRLVSCSKLPDLLLNCISDALSIDIHSTLSSEWPDFGLNVLWDVFMLNRNVMSWWCLTMTYKMLTVGNMFKGTDGKLPRTKNSIEGWHQSFNLTCPPSPLFFERYSIKLKIIWLLNLPSASCESFLSTTITMTFSIQHKDISE